MLVNSTNTSNSVVLLSTKRRSSSFLVSTLSFVSTWPLFRPQSTMWNTTQESLFKTMHKRKRKNNSPPLDGMIISDAVCPDCREQGQAIEDREEGRIVCTQCGLILNNQLFAEEIFPCNIYSRKVFEGYLCDILYLIDNVNRYIDNEQK